MKPVELEDAILEVWENDGLFYGVSLDELYRKDRIAITWDANGIKSCSSLSDRPDILSDYRNGDIEEYCIAKVDKVDNDSIQISVAAAQPSPYIEHDIDVELYQDKSNPNRLWALSHCRKYTFAQSERFWGKVAMFKLVPSNKKQSRVQKKLDEGFVFVANTVFSAKTKNFI